MDKHAHKSSQREKLIEHLLIGELLKFNWLSNDADLEISKPEVDCAGYDFVGELAGSIRHVQLKASKKGAKASSQSCHTALGQKPSGCIVWVYFDESTLSLGPILFFGDRAGHPLPNIMGYKVTKQTRANAQGKKAERLAHRRVPRTAFQVIESVSELYEKLFKRPLEVRSA